MRVNQRIILTPPHNKLLLCKARKPLALPSFTWPINVSVLGRYYPLIAVLLQPPTMCDIGNHHYNDCSVGHRVSSSPFHRSHNNKTKHELPLVTLFRLLTKVKRWKCSDDQILWICRLEVSTWDLNESRSILNSVFMIKLHIKLSLTHMCFVFSGPMNKNCRRRIVSCG